MANSILANRLEAYGGMSVNGPGKHLLLHFRRQLTGLMDLLIKDSDIIRTTVISLKNSLPQVYKKNDNRDKRSPAGLIVGSTILSGVFGTLMGWFTHKRLTNLQEQVSRRRKEEGDQKEKKISSFSCFAPVPEIQGIQEKQDLLTNKPPGPRRRSSWRTEPTISETRERVFYHQIR